MSSKSSIIKQLEAPNGRWTVDGFDVAFWAVDDSGRVLVGASIEGTIRLKLLDEAMQFQRRSEDVTVAGTVFTSEVEE